MALRIGSMIVDGPAEEVLVLPRLQGDIVIRTRAVTDMKPFEAMCPEPNPPKKLVKGGFQIDKDNLGYLDAVAKHGDLRFAYICVKSLEPSDIEWAGVSLEQPSTWKEWSQELSDAGMSSVEVNRILLAVMAANSLDETKLKQARDSFVLGMQVQSAGPSSPDTELPSTQSSKPVSDGE